MLFCFMKNGPDMLTQVYTRYGFGSTGTIQKQNRAAR